MVTIIDYEKRESSEDHSYCVLFLQGAVEFVQSKETGRFYMTARKVTISTTFNEAMCRSLVGKSYPGTIEKVECDPYEYEVPGTGETITLSHSFRYNPDASMVEENVFQPVQE